MRVYIEYNERWEDRRVMRLLKISILQSCKNSSRLCTLHDDLYVAMSRSCGVLRDTRVTAGVTQFCSSDLKRT